MREESKRAEAVVKADKHDTMTHQAFAILIARASYVAATVDPDHHRLERCGWEGRRPYVDIKAIFINDLGHAPNRVHRAGSAELECVAHAAPGFNWTWLAPA